MEMTDDVKKIPAESKDKESLIQKADNTLTSVSNAVFHHFSLFGKTVNLHGYSALFYVTLSFIATVLTFSLMMWYFSTQACVPSTLTFPGNPAQESITKQVLTTPGYYTCLTGGMGLNSMNCCTVDGLKYASSDSICNIYSAEIDHDDGGCNTECFSTTGNQLNYNLILAQMMICPNTASSLVNSAQYGLYAATFVTVVFIIGKMAAERGVLSVASRSEWDQFIEKNSNL